MLKELLNYRGEFRLLFKGGHLTRKEGHRNIVEHQVIQLLGAEVLGRLLGLSEEEKRKIKSTALIHDWDKIIDEFPNGYIDSHNLLKKVNPDQKLMSATKSEFLGKVLYGAPSFLEFLQFYLDDITMHNQIVRFDERIDEVLARKQDVNNDEELTARLGGRKYWDVEREIGHAVENMIFDRLVERGVAISSPEEIPDLIRSKIEEMSNE
jgi:hypothetical protein